MRTNYVHVMALPVDSGDATARLAGDGDEHLLLPDTEIRSVGRRVNLASAASPLRSGPDG